MRIKEVEQRTGLTAKAIRLYESKGLLKPARETENDYRDYTGEDVARLKTIAILRKLDVPVAVIKEWTDGKTELRAILQKAADQNREASRENELRHKLASDLAELLEEDPQTDLGEAVQELQELDEILEELNQIIREDEGHVATPLYSTLIALGPILGTVFGILDGAEPDTLLIGFALSILGGILTAFDWARYLKTPKRERKHGGCLSILVIIAAVLVLIFGLLIWVTNWQTAHYTTAPTDILLQRGTWGIYLLGVEAVIVFFGFHPNAKKEKWWLFEKLPKGRRAKALLAVGLAVGTAFALRVLTVSASVATAEGITRYNFFDLDGTFYSYSDVERVETGFRGKLFGIPMEWTGDFYYKITYADGTKENWGDCGTQAEEESWIWMLRFDEWCRSGGAEKTASDEFSEYCEMDQEYVDILIDVVNAR